MDRNKKFDAIVARAKALDAAKKTETFDDLRHWLNANGFTNGWGNPYHTSRGVAKLVSALWAYVAYEQGLGEAGAEPVKWAFTDQNGYYAFE